MDLFIYLRNGQIAPITGCTAVASIDDVGTSIATTATAVSGTQLLTVASNTGVVAGMRVYGVSIPALTTVVGTSSTDKVIISTPVTGTITAANVAFIGPSAADAKLLTQNSGTYRDMFSSTFETAGIDVQTPYAITPDNVFGFTTSVAGDDVAHTAPRLLTWQEALWAFTCTVDTETLTMHFLKKDVIGWGNVQPDV